MLDIDYTNLTFICPYSGLKKYIWSSSVGSSLMSLVITACGAQLHISGALVPLKVLWLFSRIYCVSCSSVKESTVPKLTCLHLHLGIILLTPPAKLQQMVPGPLMYINNSEIVQMVLGCPQPVTTQSQTLQKGKRERLSLQPSQPGHSSCHSKDPFRSS